MDWKLRFIRLSTQLLSLIPKPPSFNLENTSIMT